MLFSSKSGLLIWTSVLALSRPVDFNKRRENDVDSVLANKLESDQHSLNFINNRISPEKPVLATSACNQGKVAR
jgi:hypothetical protein